MSGQIVIQSENIRSFEKCLKNRIIIAVDLGAYLPAFWLQIVGGISTTASWFNEPGNGMPHRAARALRRTVHPKDNMCGTIARASEGWALRVSVVVLWYHPKAEPKVHFTRITGLCHGSKGPNLKRRLKTGKNPFLIFFR